jgi:hypothetical protein
VSKTAFAADMKALDLLNLEGAARALERQGIDEFHFDVADSRFVEVFGFAPAVIAASVVEADPPVLSANVSCVCAAAAACPAAAGWTIGVAFQKASFCVAAVPTFDPVVVPSTMSLPSLSALLPVSSQAAAATLVAVIFLVTPLSEMTNSSAGSGVAARAFSWSIVFAIVLN